TVVLAFLVIDATHHGADSAVHIHGNKGTLAEAALGAFGGDHFLDDELGVALHLPVNGGLHHHVGFDFAEIGGHQGFDPVGDIGFRPRNAGAHALAGVDLGGLGFFARDIAFFGHGIKR